MTCLRWITNAPNNEAFELARHTFAQDPPKYWHTHDFAEIFWVESDEGCHYVDDTRIVMRPGDLFLVRPTDRHSFQSLPGQRCTIVNLAFPAATMVNIKQRYFPRDNTFWNLECKRPPCFQLTSIQLMKLTEMMQELAKEPRVQMVIDRFLLNLSHDLIVHPGIPQQANVPEWLKRACLEIQKPANLADGTAAFVKLSGRCPEHVARATRQFLGKTPTDVVNLARLNHAARQLTLSDRKIADINFECGFESLTHFYKLFRKRFGLTPLKYRSRAISVAGGAMPMGLPTPARRIKPR